MPTVSQRARGEVESDSRKHAIVNQTTRALWRELFKVANTEQAERSMGMRGLSKQALLRKSKIDGEK